jgi:hypothetical protein
MSSCKEIIIDGVKFIPEAQHQKAKDLDGLEYCIVRTYSAGVFAGYIEKRKGQEVTMLKARRLWSWQGAASLSQMAMEGTAKPKQCKFPCEVDSIVLTQAIEVINCTEKARISIKEVSIWEIK